MRIRTAYHCTEKHLDTFGDVRFRHLVALRMKEKGPSHNLSRHRRVPHLP